MFVLKDSLPQTEEPTMSPEILKPKYDGSPVVLEKSLVNEVLLTKEESSGKPLETFDQQIKKQVLEDKILLSTDIVTAEEVKKEELLKSKDEITSLQATFVSKLEKDEAAAAKQIQKFVKPEKYATTPEEVELPNLKEKDSPTAQDSSELLLEPHQDSVAKPVKLGKKISKTKKSKTSVNVDENEQKALSGNEMSSDQGIEQKKKKSRKSKKTKTENREDGRSTSESDVKGSDFEDTTKDTRTVLAAIPDVIPTAHVAEELDSTPHEQPLETPEYPAHAMKRRDTKKKLRRPLSISGSNVLPTEEESSVQLMTDKELDIKTIPSPTKLMKEKEPASMRSPPFSPEVIQDPNAVVLTPQWLHRTNPMNVESPDEDSLLMLSNSTPPPSVSTQLLSPLSADSDSGMADEVSFSREDDVMPQVIEDDPGIFGSVKERHRRPRKIVDLQEPVVTKPKGDENVKILESDMSMQTSEPDICMKPTICPEILKPKYDDIPVVLEKSLVNNDLLTKEESVGKPLETFDQQIKKEVLGDMLLLSSDIETSENAKEESVKGKETDPVHEFLMAERLSASGQESSVDEVRPLCTDSITQSFPLSTPAAEVPKEIDTKPLVQEKSAESNFEALQSTKDDSDISVMDPGKIPSQPLDAFSDEWLNALDEPMQFEDSDEEELRVSPVSVEPQVEPKAVPQTVEMVVPSKFERTTIQHSSQEDTKSRVESFPESVTKQQSRDILNLLVAQEVWPTYYLFRDAEKQWYECLSSKSNGKEGEDTTKSEVCTPVSQPIEEVPPEVKVVEEGKETPIKQDSISSNKIILPKKELEEDKILQEEMLPAPNNEASSLEKNVCVRQAVKLLQKDEESPIDINKYSMEIPKYNIPSFLDAERNWHEQKTQLEKREYSFSIKELPTDEENSLREKQQLTIQVHEKEIVRTPVKDENLTKGGKDEVPIFDKTITEKLPTVEKVVSTTQSIKQDDKQVLEIFKEQEMPTAEVSEYYIRTMEVPNYNVQSFLEAERSWYEQKEKMMKQKVPSEKGVTTEKQESDGLKNIDKTVKEAQVIIEPEKDTSVLVKVSPKEGTHTLEETVAIKEDKILVKEHEEHTPKIFECSMEVPNYNICSFLEAERCWYEQKAVEKQRSAEDLNDDSLKQSSSQSQTTFGQSWADVVMKKKPEIEITDVKSSPHESISATQVAKPSVVPQILVVVEDDNRQEHIEEPSKQLDPEGFMEFIPRKEKRRRSRSRSRTRLDSETKPVPEQKEIITKTNQKGDDEVKTSEDEDKCTVKEKDLSETLSEVEGFPNLKEPDQERARQRLVVRSSPRPRRDSSRRKQRYRSESEQEVDNILRTMEREEILRHYLPLDGAFWSDKWRYHDAECQWQEILAEAIEKSKTSGASDAVQYTSSGGHNDRDGNGGGSSPSSPGPRSPRGGDGGERGCGPGITQLLTADLPGGICSWSDESTYLSAEDDEHASRLAQRVAEEAITDLDGDEDDGSLLISHMKASLTSDVESLQQALDNCEAMLTSVPTDTLENMYAALLNISEQLEMSETEALRLEGILKQLPPEQDVQMLDATLATLRNRVVLLLSHAEQTRSIVQRAQAQQEKRKHEVAQYQSLLGDLEVWLTSATVTLTYDLRHLAPAELHQQRLAHEALGRELTTRESQLGELSDLCTTLQQFPDVQHLAVVLCQQLVHLQAAMADVRTQLELRLAMIQEEEVKATAVPQSPLVAEPETLPDVVDEGFVLVPHSESPKPIVEQVMVASPPHERADDTIDSNASPLPDDEVSVHSLSQEVYIKEPESAVGFHVASQTGPSLAQELPPVVPLPATDMKDVAVECLPPVDMQVQTETPISSPVPEKSEEAPVPMIITATQGTTMSPPPEVQKDKIHILKKMAGGEETIEVATKSGFDAAKAAVTPSSALMPLEELKSDDDLLVQVRFKGMRPEEAESATSELNIVHTAPQSFETFVVDPGESTTEVFVDSDGTKRIVVRKTRQMTFTQQQQHQTFMTYGGDSEPVAYSQATLEGRQDQPTRVLYHGRTESGLPGQEIAVSELSTQDTVPASVLLLRGLEVTDTDTQRQRLPLAMSQEQELIPEGRELQGTSSSSVHAVVHQVTRKVIRRTRRVIRKVVIIDGKEHVTEEIVEEPDEMEVTEEGIPRVSIEILGARSKYMGTTEPEGIVEFPADDTEEPKASDDETYTSDDVGPSPEQVKIKSPTGTSDASKLGAASPVHPVSKTPSIPETTEVVDTSPAVSQAIVEELRHTVSTTDVSDVLQAPERTIEQIISTEVPVISQGPAKEVNERIYEIRDSGEHTTPEFIEGETHTVCAPDEKQTEYKVEEVKQLPSDDVAAPIHIPEECAIPQEALPVVQPGDQSIRKVEIALSIEGHTAKETTPKVTSAVRAERKSPLREVDQKVETPELEVIKRDITIQLPSHKPPTPPIEDDTKKKTRRKKVKEKLPEISKDQSPPPEPKVVSPEISEPSLEKTEEDIQSPEKISPSKTEEIQEPSPEKISPLKTEEEIQEPSPEKISPLKTEEDIQEPSPEKISPPKTEEDTREPSPEKISPVKSEEYIQEPSPVKVSPAKTEEETQEVIPSPIVISERSEELSSEEKTETLPIELEDASVETSLAESTEIIVSVGDSSDTTKPTEQEIIILGTPLGMSSHEFDSDRTHDTGYDPASELSVTEEDKRKKKRRRKKPASKSKESFESSVMKEEGVVVKEKKSPIQDSTEISSIPKTEEYPALEPVSPILVAPSPVTERKGQKRKQEEYEKEDYPMEMGYGEPQDQQFDEESYRSLKENEEPSEEGLVKVVEEGIPTRPPSESLASLSRPRSIQVFELLQTQEGGMQTVTPEEPIISVVETVESIIQASAETSEGGVQTTTPVPEVELAHLSVQTEQVPTAPMLDEIAQTVSPEPPPITETTDTFSQTLVQETPVQDMSQQTLTPDVQTSFIQTVYSEIVPIQEQDMQTSPVASPELPVVETSEMSMQTMTELPQTQEGFMQTSPDIVELPVIETAHVSIQTVTTTPEMQEGSMQTSPEVPELPFIETAHMSIQAITDTQEGFMQTSPETVEEPVVIETVHSSMQTIEIPPPDLQEGSVQTSPEIPDLPSIETVHISTQAVADTQEGFMQTSPEVVEMPPSVETIHASIQTMPEALETQEGSMQTSPEIQELPPLIETIHTSMQTVMISPEMQEGSMQTSPEPEPESIQVSERELPAVETVHTSMQTISIETREMKEGSMQTSPEVPPQPPVIETTHTSMQTTAMDTGEFSIQTNIEPPRKEMSNTFIQTIKEDLNPTSETSMQTVIVEHTPPAAASVADTAIQTVQIVPETPTGLDSSIQTVTQDLIPSTEGSTQTIDLKPFEVIDASSQTAKAQRLPVSEVTVEPPPEILPTLDSSVQTKPVQLREIPTSEDQYPSLSSDEPFEVHVRTSVVFGGGDSAITQSTPTSYSSHDEETEEDPHKAELSKSKKSKRKKKPKKSSSRKVIDSETEKISPPAESEPPSEDTSSPIHSKHPLQLSSLHHISDISVSTSDPGFVVRETESSYKTVYLRHPEESRSDVITDIPSSVAEKDQIRKQPPESSSGIISEPSPESPSPVERVAPIQEEEQEIYQPLFSVHRQFTIVQSTPEDIHVDVTKTTEQLTLDGQKPEIVEHFIQHESPEFLKTDQPRETLPLSFDSKTFIEHESSAFIPEQPTIQEVEHPDSDSKENQEAVGKPDVKQDLLPTPDEVNEEQLPVEPKLISTEDDLERRLELKEEKPQSEEKQDTVSVGELCHPDEQEWKQASAIMTDRVRNLQNARRTTHLSGVLYLATLHQVVPDESVEEKNNNVQRNLDALKSAVEKKDVVVIQRTVITTVETISTWLETIEYRVLLYRQQGMAPTPEQIKELGELKQEIGCLERNVGALNEAVEATEGVCNEDDEARMKQCISCLQEQVKAVEEVTAEKEQQAAIDLNRWEEFLNGVNNVSVLVEELKDQLEGLIEADMAANAKLQELDQVEVMNRSHRWKTTQLLGSARILLRDFPGHEVPLELYSAHESTRAIEHCIGVERERQFQLLALADEYEQTLKEFAQITDVADDLVESPIMVSSLDHLQEEMQKHRKFFVNLSHCRGILESLEGNLDAETRAQHSSLHQQLHSRATVILDKAAGRAQQMALAASRWTVLEQGMRDECAWLQVAHQRVPDLQSVTSSDYDQYISLYQSLSADAAVHFGRSTQLIEVARRLQELVSCPGLETCYDEHLEVITKLQEDVNFNLRRLLSFRETWTAYEILSDKLGFWMKNAERELANFSAQGTTPGTNMRHFWELKAQYEVHNNIRNEASSHFDAAMCIIPVADETLQRQLHAQLEERWRAMSVQMHNIQVAVTETLADQDVPVKDKLGALEQELIELQAALDDMHGILKTEEELELYIQRLQVMTGRVQHIQQELGRLGLLSAAESEKVGALLGGAGRLEVQVAEELEGATLLRDKLQAIQKGMSRVRRNHQRATSVLDQCEASERQGRESVEQAVRNCQAVGDELTALWQDVIAIRQLLHTLPMGLRLSVSPIQVERDMSQLQDQHSALETRCVQLLSLLRSRLALWQRFERQLELVQQSVQEADYMMELLTVQGSVDYDRLLKATERLEGLYGSLDQREELLDDLRSAAEPLAASCDPEVSAKIEEVVEQAVTSWNDTCQSLRELCDRYQDAARLWRQYREASDCVKTWADQLLDSTAQLTPDEALNHVKVCEETLSAHQARLSELRGLVAQIAADVGLDCTGPLGDEVAALGRRLEDVRESLAALAEVAEARAAGQDELISTKAFLSTVQQSLTVVEEANQKDTENQLEALRNHLLNLGKTEGQLQSLKEKNLDLGPSKNETSVVEILQLWQQVFRETFQQYHRLSARLVKSQDGAAALRLWQEYLLHVQSFLSGSIPEDYNSLTEHQHLCEVHQNLLTSQQSVLLSKSDANEGRLGGGLVELSVVEQFNSLTNLHNETLARIMERHSEVRDRLAAWDRYRKDQARLLGWLRDRERERSHLQLRYIHLRRVPKVQLCIQTLLDKVPIGEAQAEELRDQQDKLLRFCDDALATSIRMEHAAISQRISNLKAGLETWKDFLDRIGSLQQTYDSRVTSIQTVFQDVRGVIRDSDVPMSHTGMQNRLENLRLLRSRLQELTSDLEAVGVTVEQLKECVSPMDMKTLNQRVWLLWQTQDELSHQLSLRCHEIEEKLNMYTLFEARRGRFLVWVSDVESRLDRAIEGDPQEVLRRLETELSAEVSLKSREADWLLEAGKELAAACDTEVEQERRAELERQTAEVRQHWERLKGLSIARANKLQDILQNMAQLEQRLAELKVWLHQVETQLATPLVFESCNKDAFDEKLNQHEELQKTIEMQSSNVGEVLNLYELLLSNSELSKTSVNTESITIATEALERRWKAVCGQSAERKRRIMAIWTLLEDLLKLCKEQEQWLTEQEAVLNEIDSLTDLGSQGDVQKLVSRVETVVKEVQTRSPALQILDQSFSRLAKESRMEPESLHRLTILVRDTLRRWHALAPNAARILERLRQELQVYRDFVAAHGKAVVSLTQVDVRLTQIQHLSTPEQAAQPAWQLQEVEKLEGELESQSGVLRIADELGLQVLQKSRPEELAPIQEMIDEYQLLWKDIKARLAALRLQCEDELKKEKEQGRGVVQEVDESVQVSTLRFEQDSAVQVDTLPHLKRLTSRDAYLYELDSAIKECNANLQTLEELVQVPIGGSPAKSALAKALASCQSSIELTRHLSNYLMDSCGVAPEQARTSEVSALCSRYEQLCALARTREQSAVDASESARLTCPLCSRRNWQQLDNDLWRLEQWLQFSEGIQRNQQVPPSNIEQLEDTIQDHREFLMDLDSHKSIVVSLNIVGTHLADHTEDRDRAEQLRARLVTTNSRWDAVCRTAAQWQTQLERALMENHEFHRIIEELVEWLERTETTIRLAEPVDLADDISVIESKYNKFRELRSDLERCEPRVMSLQDAADQLLRRLDAPEGSVWARLTDLRLRLQSLRRLTGIYILKLGAVLGRDPSELGMAVASTTVSGRSTAATSLVSLSHDLLDQAAVGASLYSESQHSNDAGSTNMDPSADGVDTTVLTRGYRFLGRVLRASLPIQALMLLLLGVASLVPTCEEDCNLTNNFARSFEPMLQYRNGPPPV
ncbi:muscle-specific protein 300 kDa isoform X2 [Anabrus simplex]|uniref:muscle-specific protein 300 kDa isoform X2 n=1 Tax=Anabrus simplex TaxID=316456 RepID=UPI0035A314CD